MPKRVEAFGRTIVRSRRWKTQSRPCFSRIRSPSTIKSEQLLQEEEEDISLRRAFAIISRRHSHAEKAEMEI